MTPPENVVIVGASLAGLRAAEALREGGYQGGLTLIGQEIHPPYDRPPLSKQVLQGWVKPSATVLARRVSIRATWRRGQTAVALDRDKRSVRLASGDDVGYDRLIIATGTRARPWHVAGQRRLAGVHVLRTIEDAAGLVGDLDADPDRVLIVGAGFTGSEVASACRDRGLATTVVDRNQVPMAKAFGSLLGSFFANRQREGGVDLRLGLGVVELLGGPEGRVTGARLSDGSVVGASVVVLCLGSLQNAEWLLGSGIDVRQGGCRCDVHCRAVDLQGEALPDIFVCGDVSRFCHQLSDGRHIAVEHWATAVDQAEVAASNLLRPGSLQYFSQLPRFWSMQFGLSLKSAGLPDCADSVAVVQGALTSGRFVALYGRQGRTIAAVACNQARWMRYYEQLVEREAPFPPRDRIVDQAREAQPLAALFPARSATAPALAGPP